MSTSQWTGCSDGFAIVWASEAERDLSLIFSTGPVTDDDGEERTGVSVGIFSRLLQKESALPAAERQTYRLHAELAPNVQSRHAKRTGAAASQSRQPAAAAAAGAAAATEGGSPAEADAPAALEAPPPRQQKCPKQNDWQSTYGDLVHEWMPHEDGKYVTVCFTACGQAGCTC